jgi:hypothetical protein
MKPNIFLCNAYCQEDYFSQSLAYILNLFPTIGQSLLNRIAVLAEQPFGFFGDFQGCEFVGHEFQEDHLLSKPDLKITCQERVLYFENKLESPLSLNQMERHALLTQGDSYSNIVFVSNIQHKCSQLKNLSGYLCPAAADHFLWADFLPVFSIANRKNSLSDRILSDFHKALRANGMIGRTIYGAKDNLYSVGSDACHLALTQLWKVMNEIGFKLTKKIQREMTIRAYPVKHQAYPLLNPRFIPTAIGFSEELDREFLQIVVYSKNDPNEFDKQLATFQSTVNCMYIPATFKNSTDYNLHGDFLIPLFFKGKGRTSEIDFDALRQPLKTILDFWKQL